MTAQKFRKKPVEIEAVRVRAALNDAAHDWPAMPQWLRDAYDDGSVFFVADHVLIKTLEGEMRADLDDWIIRGVKGELYPCKPDIFAATYQPVAKPGRTPASGVFTFDTLRLANLMRLPRFRDKNGNICHPTQGDVKPGFDWLLSQWANATAGELGEACNIIKKIERGDFTLDQARPDLGREFADMQTYLDLLAYRAGVDLGEATRQKWNEVSERVGFPFRIERDGSIVELEVMPAQKAEGEGAGKTDAPSLPVNDLVKAMVDRFLSWRLPDTFNPDCHITFDKTPDARGNPITWPVGTNLFCADEAKAMVEHMLGALQGWRLVPWCSCNNAEAEVGACCDHMKPKPVAAQKAESVG